MSMCIYIYIYIHIYIYIYEYLPQLDFSILLPNPVHKYRHIPSFDNLFWKDDLQQMHKTNKTTHTHTDPLSRLPKPEQPNAFSIINANGDIDISFATKPNHILHALTENTTTHECETCMV